MPVITIDHRAFSVKENTTILEAAIEQDIYIPTLCYNSDLSPGGKCRLCAVELLSPRRRNALVLACAYPIKQDMEVLTESRMVLDARKKAMRALFRKAPHALRLKEMAKKIGIDTPSLSSDAEGCILCGLCIRACNEIVGRKAITFKRKGNVVTGILADPNRCIGCGTCAYLCPADHIKIEDHGEVRIIWNKVFRKKDHLISGKYFAPLDRVKYVIAKESVSADQVDTHTLYSYKDDSEKRRQNR